MNTLMLAAACSMTKCAAHAVPALAIAFIVGFLIGRRTAKGAASGRKGSPKPSRRPVRPPETRVPIPAGSVEIYVGNLSYDLTEEQLRKEFEAFGKVDTARVVTNRFNDRSKGFGFVVMPNRPEAEAAIAAMNDKEVLGRRMRVNEAKNTVVKEA
jgi:RNA recognition motif-containing protein